MGLFDRAPRKPMIEIEGVIERIGLASVQEMYVTYAILIVGGGRRYEVMDSIGMHHRRVNLELTMAKPGDRVGFCVRDAGDRWIEQTFRNYTMRPEQTGDGNGEMAPGQTAQPA